MKKVAVWGATAWLSFSVQAYAQTPDIDPLSLPPSGLERTYACRSNLNALSAMMQAQKMEKEGKALLGLYLVLSDEVVSQAKAAGIPEADYQRRMSDWDAATVVASLKHPDAVIKDMAPCMKMAAKIYNERESK